MWMRKGVRPIENLSSRGNIDILGHDCNTEWDSDEKHHWHECRRCFAKTDAGQHEEDLGTVSYEKESFYKKHLIISFDTLYEERTYDIIAVFRSQVYKADEDVLKYYQFYETETPKEFEDFTTA